MGRPPVKSSYAVEKAKTLARLQAETEHLAKTFSQAKTTRNWFIDRLTSVLERIDPVEMLAILATTFFIKQGIEWTEDIPSTLLQKDSLLRGALKFYPFVGPLIDLALPTLPPEAQEAIEKGLDSPQAEVIQYMISFIVAYVIIRHPEAIISLGGNILGVAKGLIGGLG